MKIKILLTIASCFFAMTYIQAQTPAFPTAEGYGKYAKGGRGGQVVFVTNLDDYIAYNNIEPEIPGSLRWALKQYPGQPLTVIFRVSGTIKLKPYLTMNGSTVYNQNDLRVQRTNLTIAGQTAPGEGICIRNTKVNFGGSTDLIIRNVRFRVGEAADATPIYGYKVGGVVRDTLAHAGTFIPGGSMGCENALRVIIDHCVFGWSGEENITMYDNRYTSVQWCIMHEGLYDDGHGKGNRSYGGQCGGINATWHHNLFAHNYSRSPRLNGARTDNEIKVFIEFINNVNYNWGRQGAPYGGELYAGTARSHTANFTNNYYKPGPGTDASRIFFNLGSLVVGANAPKWYLKGNIMEGNESYNADNWKGFTVDYSSTGLTQAGIKSDTLLFPPLANVYGGAWIGYTPFRINIESAQNAYNSVLNKVGTVHRDSVERRIIREMKTGTATFKASQGKWGIIDKSFDAEGYLPYPSAQAPADNDNDGMADDWETAHGLNPSNPDDRNWTTTEGYTALEVYLNSLMGENINLVFSDVKSPAVASIQIYPTEVTDRISFKSDVQIDEISVYNPTGTRVMTTKLMNENSVDVSSLSKGIYFLEIKSDGQNRIVSKFIKK